MGVFFIYDHTVLQKEEDDLKDAILYFYPPFVRFTKKMYLCPPDRMIGGILFLSCLFVCLSVVNFNLRYNFRGRNFIFDMHTPLMMPFQMIPRSMTL